MAYPTGEAKPAPLRVDFDSRLTLTFHGSTIISHAGLLAYRELVRLQLHALADNLNNFLRMALPQEVGHSSLTTLRDKLIEIVREVRAT